MLIFIFVFSYSMSITYQELPLKRIILVTTHHQGLVGSEHMAGLYLGEVIAGKR